MLLAILSIYFGIKAVWFGSGMFVKIFASGFFLSCVHQNPVVAGLTVLSYYLGTPEILLKIFQSIYIFECLRKARSSSIFWFTHEQRNYESEGWWLFEYLGLVAAKPTCDETYDEYITVVWGVWRTWIPIDKPVSWNASTLRPMQYVKLTPYELLNSPPVAIWCQLAILMRDRRMLKLFCRIPSLLGFAPENTAFNNMCYINESEQIVSYEFSGPKEWEHSEVDGRADSIAMGKMLHANPNVYSVLKKLGAGTCYHLEVVSVSVEVLAQMISNPTLFNMNDDLSTADSKLNLQFKNMHSVNIQRHCNLKENLMIETLQCCRYYLRYKRSRIIKFSPMSLNDEAAL
jgi:hypothetical protein